VGKFKAPTLRNIAVTGPYMHDGSIATLEDVLAHYAAGGRTIASGPDQGIGHDNPNKSATVRGFALSTEQRADLIAFLRSLTDEQLLRDPRFSNPWRSAVH
jgi:cytochrome c peroxidase